MKINLATQRSSLSTVTLLVALIATFACRAQNFEISQDVYDSLSPTSYLIHVTGYGTFTTSMDIEVELITDDSIQTVVYSGSKSFDLLGSNTLTNFSYNPITEVFSFDIGTYSNLDYFIRLVSKENGEIQEELQIFLNQ